MYIPKLKSYGRAVACLDRISYFGDQNDPNHRGILVLEPQYFGVGTKYRFYLAVLKIQSRHPRVKNLFHELVVGSAHGADLTPAERRFLIRGLIEGLRSAAAVVGIHLSQSGRIDVHLLLLNETPDGKVLSTWLKDSEHHSLLYSARQLCRALTKAINERRLLEGRSPLHDVEAINRAKRQRVDQFVQRFRALLEGKVIPADGPTGADPVLPTPPAGLPEPRRIPWQVLTRDLFQTHGDSRVIPQSFLQYFPPGLGGPEPDLVALLCTRVLPAAREAGQKPGPDQADALWFAECVPPFLALVEELHERERQEDEKRRRDR